MRRFPAVIVFTLAVVAGLGTFGQTTPTTPPAEKPKATGAPTAPRTNSAIVPQLNRRFMGRHTAFVEIAKKGDIDILFMGDSITDWWRSSDRGGATGDAAPFAGKPAFDKYFGSMKVANFGIAG